jgi:5'-3' exonuclease
MAKYLLIDTANTFFRARHIAHRGADTWDKMGIAVHITLNSVLKCWNKQKADHVVFALEGRSWRKDMYEPYKKNRAVSRAALTEREAEEDKMFWEIFDDLTTFLKEKTNCSVVRSEIAEADDVIARWIATHPNDEHVIVSSDTDFIQLLDENVHQYNGITQELHTLKGIFNDAGERVIDKKTKEYKAIPDPEWLLFEKCVRGDTSDNVFSAYPGARKKGTKNKVGMLEAFEDRGSKGYNWNNFMLQRWVDHNEVEHRVLDDYERNKQLIDLTEQPQEVKDFVDTQINEAVEMKANTMVGAKFLKFCGKYELIKLAEQAARYAEFLQARYPQK